MPQSAKTILISKDAEHLKDNLRDILGRFAEGFPGMISCGKGWYPILADLNQKIKAIYPDYQVLQVKEKYGGMRFYFEEEDLLRGVALLFEKKNPYPDPDDQAAVDAWFRDLDLFQDSEEGKRRQVENINKLERIEKLVRDAEEASLQTCESCGKAGEMRQWRGQSGQGSAWLMTRCDDCWKRQVGE